MHNCNKKIQFRINNNILLDILLLTLWHIFAQLWWETFVPVDKVFIAQHNNVALTIAFLKCWAEFKTDNNETHMTAVVTSALATILGRINESRKSLNWKKLGQKSGIDKHSCQLNLEQTCCRAPSLLSSCRRPRRFWHLMVVLSNGISR